MAIALASPYFLSDSLLERFDIVGMDPRGIGFSDPVSCFADAGHQQPVLARLDTGFPYGKKEEKAFLKASAGQGRACSTTGRALAGSMSTAEVARDMDVMRRAVGDRKLSYLGFSYGTALGQYYANMFPDRFRAIAVDGVINPVAWVGANSKAVQDDRLHSADGAWRALHEILDRCNTAGATKCAFSGQAIRRFRVLTDRLKAEPLSVDGQKITYPMFVSMALSALYDVHAGAEVTALAAAAWRLATPGAQPTELTAAQATVTRAHSRFADRAFPYDNSFDAYTAVMCTDGRHAANGTAWIKAGAKADKRAPYFGRAWVWSSASCARNTWTVRDEDAYTGPFNRKTKNPVLFVGNYWDPATNYADAVSSSKLLPNSRLLSSTNWGHTAYGTSPCVTTAMDRYLLSRTLPTRARTCIGTAQPFRTLLSEDPDELTQDTFDLNTATLTELAAHGLPTENTPKHLPPVR